MQISDAVFHLVVMQQKAQRDADFAREEAQRGHSASRRKHAHLAAHHDAEALALDFAITALIPNEPVEGARWDDASLAAGAEGMAMLEAERDARDA